MAVWVALRPSVAAAANTACAAYLRRLESADGAEWGSPARFESLAMELARIGAAGDGDSARVIGFRFERGRLFRGSPTMRV